MILSSLSYNRKVGLALACPITGQVKDYPFEVPIPPGYPVTGVVLADHVKSLDWHARNAQLICRLPIDTLEEVLAQVDALLWT